MVTLDPDPRLAERSKADVTRLVVHDAEGDWLVSDDVNDPNGNAVLVCMEHLVAADGTIAELAAMPPGTEAWRPNPGEPWPLRQHTYADA